MREIVEVDPARRLARVQPGVVRDQLAKHCERHDGLTFAPTRRRTPFATFGGMIGLPPAWEPVLLSRVALELSFSDEDERRRTSANAALDKLRDAPPWARALTLRCATYALWRPGRTRERLALAEELLVASRAAGDVNQEMIGVVRRMVCWAELGERARMIADIAEIERLRPRVGTSLAAWCAAAGPVFQAFVRGDYATAERLADAVRDRFALTQPNALAGSVLQLAMLRWEHGRLGELCDLFVALGEQRPGLNAAFPAYAALGHAQAGRRQQAQLLLDDLVDRLPALAHNALHMHHLAATALAARELEDRRAAASSSTRSRSRRTATSSSRRSRPPPTGAPSPATARSLRSCSVASSGRSRSTSRASPRTAGWAPRRSSRARWPPG